MAAVASVALLAAPSAAQAHGHGAGLPRLSLVDTISVPAGGTQLGTPFGGLSGIDYDARTGTYTAISDDRSALAPARWYSLRLPLDRTGFAATAPRVTGVTTLRGADGAPFANGTVDPESIRLAGRDRLLWTSEGAASTGLAPTIREASGDGAFRRDYRLPAAYLPAANRGVRNNLAFEALTLSADGRSIVAATEAALAQDGPIATLDAGTGARVLVLDRSSGRTRAEYVYRTEAIPAAPTDPANPYADRGLTELLALNDTDYLAVERSFAGGVGFTVQVFWTTTRGATNAAGRDALTGRERVMPKRLLLDLNATGTQVDNVEGITWGPRLPNGDRSLVLVADDNFNSFTQFHLLRVANR
ncbi:esterase-like activity of phytase family protein [Catenuloplanes niger JCM 9533]